ncbi:MAG: polysaccharide biosynthesis/export family protein [Caulobacter sp.]|nr:polysaccharide biosynthesis/export family protein [Caulobacter sp.]
MRPNAPSRAVVLACVALLAASPAVAARAPAPAFANIGYADWTEQEPEYRFYPGDTIDITVPSAPELARTGVIVQPDGRITMPLVAPVMAADRTITELQDELTRAYASQLLRPEVVIQIKSVGALKVFVGGEVGAPGVFDMPGDINSLQAVIQAGGFRPTAKVDRVVIIRRGPGGRAMMRTVDLKGALKNPLGADLVPLRRFDIVYVPRSNIAEAGLFMQQWFRDVSPIQGFSYAIGGNNGTN